MKKKSKKGENLKDELIKGDIFKPIKLDDLGGDSDPCFGLHYDLSTRECKMCGDSELCCIKFAEKLGKTRKEMEKENEYKDLEILVDKAAVKKTFRSLKRKGEDKKTILQKIQAKYELSLKEARILYREFSNK